MGMAEDFSAGVCASRFFPNATEKTFAAISGKSEASPQFSEKCTVIRASTISPLGEPPRRKKTYTIQTSQ